MCFICFGIASYNCYVIVKIHVTLCIIVSCKAHFVVPLCMSPFLSTVAVSVVLKGYVELTIHPLTANLQRVCINSKQCRILQ